MALRGSRKGSIAQKCNICGGYPAGIHFGGGPSCEGCMAFFKRNAEKSASLRCYFGKNCDLKLERTDGKDRSKFTRCKACRFQKCLDEGMQPEVAVRGKHAKKLNSTAFVPDQCSPNGSITVHLDTSNMSQKDSGTKALDSDILELRTLTAVPLFSSRAPTFSIMDLGSLIASPKISDIRPGNENYLPPFLRKYHTLLHERDSFLSDTAMAVEHAAFNAFNDQVHSWSTFMNRALTFGEVPAQPEQSVELMIGYLAVALSDQQSRTATFASLLPGFPAFNALQKKHRLAERFSEVFVIHYSAYVENEELYVQIGPRKAHLCRYWRDQLLNKDYHRLSWPLINELKNLELTMSERYVLLAACLFKPKTRESSACTDTTTLSSLHRLYMNVLEHLIRSRSTEANAVIERLQLFIDRLDIYQKLHEKYMPPVEPQEPVDPAIFSAVLAPDERLLPEIAQ